MKIKEKLRILAIDPGKKGGLAGRDEIGVMRCCPMPATVHDLVIAIGSLKPDLIYLEKVHTMPKQGIVSAGTFMKGVGQIEGICAAYSLPLYEVSPQKWTKYFELGTRKSAGNVSEWKKKLKAKAQKLFPGLNVTYETADALLIWHYAIQTHKF